MRITIDRAGRIVLPKPLRARLGLEGGEELDVVERDGVIELRRAPVEVDIRDTAEGVVATPREPLGTVDDESIRDTLERVRP